jgi:hypothetical protein
VDGHVVDAATHEPVAGATVSANQEVVGLTDGGGRFLLARLCPGELTIEVDRADYQAGRQTVTVGRATSVELELRPSLSEVIVIEGEKPRTVRISRSSGPTRRSPMRRRSGGLAGPSLRSAR